MNELVKQFGCDYRIIYKGDQYTQNYLNYYKETYYTQCHIGLYFHDKWLNFCWTPFYVNY